MRILFTLLLSTFLIATVATVATAATAATGATLRVGTSGDYAPFSLDGRGFDIEVAESLASDLGLRLEWVTFRWPELAEAVASGAMDIAMSGVTWRTDRAVTGWMSRAVAAGGPCLLVADARLRRIGVNRGGFLERWVRSAHPDPITVPLDENRELPQLLASGAVDAIATDHFELRHFSRPEWEARCEPPRHRKVYWVTPSRAEELGPRIDAWIENNEPWLAERRQHWFGDAQPRTEADHLVDLLARRLAFMPEVAAWKRARGRAIADARRERVVLDGALRAAAAAGLSPSRVEPFFALQIELAKAVQRRAAPTSSRLDLVTEVRPALIQLGDRIVRALAQGATLAGAAETPLREWLEPDEVARLAAAIAGDASAPADAPATP